MADPLKIRSFSTVDVNGVWFFSACDMVQYNVYGLINLCF